MADRDKNYTDKGEYNQRIGRELSNRNQNTNQQRYGYRGSNDDRQWGEGNYFHTGPSPRGAQDTERRYGENYQHNRNSTYAQERNQDLHRHYGTDASSAYRNERNSLNRGDRDNYQHSQQHSIRRPHTPSGALEGNRTDVSDYQNDQWREGPGSRSRYKEDDYRYGSGSHNWYREGRYTPDSDETAPHPRDHRGFFDRVKDTWNDIWHSDDPNYRPHNRYQAPEERISSRERHGSEAYRDRRFDRGYEGGPRWSDEIDSGHDNYYNDTDRTQRYRR